MKIFLKKSLWVMLSIYLALWFVVSCVAGVVLDGFKNVINSALGLTGYRTETLVTDENEDLLYFKSDFFKTDSDDNPIYTLDAKGFKRQSYDDAALKAAALKKADQVQREGTTILWNKATGSSVEGLPLAKNSKVSLFSHSSVAWVQSGGGSGNANVQGANLKTALTNAGLKVNTTLWDFYTTGAGKDYTRTDRWYMNDVPWSKYTTTVKNSFLEYGDAAILVLSRRAGEGSVAQGGAFDVTQTGADTPSGDYYDMSTQERETLNQIIAAKKEGTFKKVIVLLNTPTGMWFENLLKNKTDIDACIWAGQTGYEGINEVGRINSIDFRVIVNLF